MRVKIVAQFNDENGDYRHADISKGLFLDVRDHIGELWVKNGWAIMLPPEAGSKAVIETPEDHSEVDKRETANIRRRIPK